MVLPLLSDPQQLLSLQEELKRKELELEQAQDEQRCLEAQILTLKEKLLNNMDCLEGNNERSEKVSLPVTDQSL